MCNRERILIKVQPAYRLFSFFFIKWSYLCLNFNTEARSDEGVVTQSKKDLYCRANIPEYMQQVFYAWGQW